VDDHAGFLAWARAFLVDEGYEVVGQASDGAGGLEVVERTRPDLVLLDVRLPDLDGFEVADRLRSMADPPVVVLISSAEAREYGMRLGQTAAAGFLAKSDLSGPALAGILGGQA
jgi:DNA-binding NarL/FixJ family response regulator